MQCKRSGKFLFASGCGVPFLVYFCATGFAPIRVINGCGKGGNVAGIDRVLERQAGQLHPGEVFLDNVTGDFYAYNQVSKSQV